MAPTGRKARSELNSVDELITRVGNDEHKKRAKTLRKEVEEFIEQKDSIRLPRKTEQVVSLYGEILVSQDEYWVLLFQHAKENQSKMGDQAMASRLIDQGQNCIQRGDIQTLRQVVAQLLDLLPRGIQEEVRRGGYIGDGEIGLLK